MAPLVWGRLLRATREKIDHGTVARKSFCSCILVILEWNIHPPTASKQARRAAMGGAGGGGNATTLAKRQIRNLSGVLIIAPISPWGGRLSSTEA